MINLPKNEIAFLKDHSDTMLYQNLSDSHFHVFTLFVTATVGRFGLPCHINLKGLHLQIILTKFY